MPPDFIVKPALGFQGVGVAAFCRDGAHFVHHDGRILSETELYEFLRQERQGNRYSKLHTHHSLRLPEVSHKALVQERYFSDPEVERITGSRSICTCRVLTRLVPSGGVQVLATAFRAVTGTNVADNLAQGRSGNLFCSVDLERGFIVEAFAKAADRERLELVTRHPTTGRPIRGFEIPHWNVVLDLAQRLARAFRPQPLITWDIGMSREGPVVIEGNVGGQFLPAPLNKPVRSLLVRHDLETST